MVAGIVWGLIGLGVAACGEDATESPTDGGVSGEPEVSEEKGGDPLPLPERRRYERPPNPPFPQPNNYGIFYHPLVQATKMVQETATDGGMDGGVDGVIDGGVDGGVDGGTVQQNPPPELSSLVGFQYDDVSSTFYFGSGPDLFSFAAENYSNSDPLTILKRMTFSRPLSNLLIKKDRVVALLNGPPSGVEIRNLEGDLIDSYIFGGGIRVYSPTLTGLISVGDELWISTSSNREGTIFILRENEDGSLVRSPKGSFTTTQLYPKALANWESSGQTYILAVNRGGSGRFGGGSGVDVFYPSALDNQHLGNVPLGFASASTITISNDGNAAFVGSANKPYLYLLDLERLQKNIEAMGGRGEPASWPDVPLADATNPILLSPFESGFVSGLAYDASAKTVLVSLHEEGFLLQIQAGYTLLPGDGIAIAPDFGVILGNYLCNDLQTQFCSELTLFEGGALATTEIPASVTFLPNERLGR